MLGGTGVIVLNKVKIPNQIPKGLLVPRLEKKTPSITEDLRLQEVGIMNLRGDFLHKKRGTGALSLLATLEDTPKIGAVAGLSKRLQSALKRFLVEEAHLQSNLLKAGNPQALTVLDGPNEIGSFEQ